MQHNSEEIRNRIINFLKVRGPSLPIHIAKETGLSVLFASAYLAELLGNKEIKISDMKVGGSPVYFIPGQEPLLENYTHFFKGKEKEAYLLLKEKKVLDDTKLEPAIRVALRQLKDFAYPIHAVDNGTRMLFWRYLTVCEEDAKTLIQTIYQPKPTIQPAVLSPTPSSFQIQENKQTLDLKEQTHGPVKEISEKKPKIKKLKLQEKSEFIESLKKALIEENIELLEEKEIKKKEFYGLVRVNSDIGKMKFLLIFKDKKKITDTDIELAIQKSHSTILPILLIYTGEIDKKASSLLEQYSGLINIKKIDL